MLIVSLSVMEGGLVWWREGGEGYVTRAGTKQILQRNKDILLRDPTRPHSHLSTRYTVWTSYFFFKNFVKSPANLDLEIPFFVLNMLCECKAQTNPETIKYRRAVKGISVIIATKD
jgi:hypothetical protein